MTVDILLVEDDAGDARLIEEAFKSSGFEATLHTITRGEEALSFLTEHRRTDSLPYPDLVLLDINLPGMDGFSVLEALRQSDHRLLPVIMLTGSQATEDVKKSYELTANAYLTKPSDHDDFVALVRAVEKFWFNTAHLPTISP